jgi:hypothetical protein
VVINRGYKRWLWAVVINRGYKSWQKFYSLPKRYNRIRCFTFISGKHSWGDAGHKSRLYPSRGLFVMHMSQDISCISCGGVFLISCEKFALSFKIIVVIIKENIWNFLLSFSIISLVVCKGQLVRMNINFKKTPVAKWKWIHLHNYGPKDRCSCFMLFFSIQNARFWLKICREKRGDVIFASLAVVRRSWMFILDEIGMRSFYLTALYIWIYDYTYDVLVISRTYIRILLWFALSKKNQILIFLNESTIHWHGW